MVLDIVKVILDDLPTNVISDVFFEGANIILYTKDRDFFLDDKGAVKAVVTKLKKRIELRPHPDLCLDQETATKEIKKILKPFDCGVKNVLYDRERSLVTIEVDKPGAAIGRVGENLKKIKTSVFWVPIVIRSPAIKSKIIDNIRNVLYQNSEYRRKFLHKVGKRVYSGWQRQKKEEWVRISFLGSGRQVGRSAILLQTPESRILLDCGIDVASPNQPYPYLESPEFRIDELDAVVLSHAHLDHCGFIPFLYKYGFKGPIYCTEPTRDIMALSCLDLVKIQANENKPPIYSSEEVKDVVNHCIPIGYEQVTDITPDVRITLYNAGHMMGSAMVHLHIGNGLHNLVYTGDMKYGKTNLLSPAVSKFPRVESLIIESTYGGRECVSSTRENESNFTNLVINTLKKKGKVLMPVLGSGRAQEVLVMIQDLIDAGKIDQVPIYIDGIVWDMTAIYTAYPEYMNSTMRTRILHNNDNPFLRENVRHVGSSKDRKAIIEESNPCIILATSGMLVGGPSVEYLKALAEDSRNALVFSCYQGRGSLGREIQQGISSFSYKNGKRVETVDLKLQIDKVEVSGHSDRRELMNFIHRCNPRPRKVIVNHGDVNRTTDLAQSIYRQYKIETVSPRNLEVVRLR